jgi:hypothetical protein
MEPIFTSIGQEIYNIKSHKGYLVQWSLVAPLCKKWIHNRDYDNERVKEILNYHCNGGYVPRVIHLAEIEREGLVCYDGNHRREVFDRCTDESIMCVVDVMFRTTQSCVFKAFNNINKSVQLPAIYLEESIDSCVKDDILKLVRMYETEYKAFVSTSTRCHAPQFNRDAFVDNIDSIYKAFHGVVSIIEIGTVLRELNVQYCNQNMCRPHSAYSVSVIEKCRTKKLWLFLEKTIPFVHVERLYEEMKKQNA